MTAAIAEPASQPGASLDPGAQGVVASADPAADLFLTMLANLLDAPAPAPPPAAPASPSVAMRPVFDGSAVVVLVEASAPTFTAPGVAPAAAVAPPGSVAPAPGGPPSPAVAPAAAGTLLVPTAPALAPPPPVLPGPAMATPPSAPSLPVSVANEPPAPPEPVVQVDDPPIPDPKPAKAAPAAKATSANPKPDNADAEPAPAPAAPPSTASALPLPPPPPPPPPAPAPAPAPDRAATRMTDPMSGPPAVPDAPSPPALLAHAPAPESEPARPRDDTATAPIEAAAASASPPDRLPDAIAQAAMPSPSHHAAPPEPTVIHVASAPPAQPATSQVGSAFVVLGRAGDGVHQLTLVLQPPDLGDLRIAIEQAKDSPAKIAVTASNPTTLLTLLRDQPALNKALDDAGIGGEGRVLTFHLAATPEPAPVAAAPTSQNAGDSLPSGSQNPGPPGQFAQTSSGRGGQDPPPSRPEPPATAWFADIAPLDHAPPVIAAHQLPTGIDITA